MLVFEFTGLGGRGVRRTGVGRLSGMEKGDTHGVAFICQKALVYLLLHVRMLNE